MPGLCHRPANGAIRAVVFDLDGVLVDSESLNVRSAREAFDAVGRPLDETDLATIVGRHPDDYVPEIAARRGLADVDVDRVREIQEARYLAWRADDARLVVPGAREVAGRVRGRGLATGVATSSGREHALACLERSGLRALFDAVVTGDDVAARKPAPDAYLLSASNLGVAPGHLLALEDSVHGVRAAVAAGAPCLGVATEWTEPGTLLAAGALAVLPALAALPAWLDKVGDGGP